MIKSYENLIKSVEHLKVLNTTFLDKDSFSDSEDYERYKENSKKLSELMALPPMELHKQMYNEDSRQMILADIIEYILLSRGLFSMVDGASTLEKKKERKKLFMNTILYFVNLLMIYESITVDDKLRKKFLTNLAEVIPEVRDEVLFKKLLEFKGKVGLTEKESDADKELNSYFDKILPKTAGGLWHELLVYIFLIRKNLGYVIPLILEQKLISGSDILTPPDFLILTRDKSIYGVEVGRKKEIQSGVFSLKSKIPTASIDTENSRNSDRCPVCHKWILFCPRVIDDFSDIDKNIGDKSEIKCLDGSCSKFKIEEIVKGVCPYSKYSRNAIKSINHKYTTGLHYHYRCVLNNLSSEDRKKLIEAKDITAIKTHYPNYSGLEPLEES